MVLITHLHTPSLLQMRTGESVIDYLPQVEDTKGNNGHRGMLLLCYHGDKGNTMSPPHR